MIHRAHPYPIPPKMSRAAYVEAVGDDVKSLLSFSHLLTSLRCHLIWGNARAVFQYRLIFLASSLNVTQARGAKTFKGGSLVRGDKLNPKTSTEL
jgi:hypothetical protein